MAATEPGEPVPRWLDLDAGPARCALRPPYGAVDIGASSVRIVVYDQLGRAPLPWFNDKVLCRLSDGRDDDAVSTAGSAPSA